MNYNVYSIFDRAAKDCSTPFVAVSDDAAFRVIKGAFNPQSQLVLYPSDYVVYLLGEFDSETGRIVSALKEVKEIKNLIPISMRELALDGTFERGVEHEAKENPSAQS